MVRGDGIVLGWLGHPSFSLPDGSHVFPRRMPSFFETFPIIFMDQAGVVRADQPFRRAEAKYALDAVGLQVQLLGGALSGVMLDAPSTTAAVARLAQFGELLDFDRSSVEADGVLRSSVRGWYVFSHLTFALLFLFGHWWHASRTLYRDLLSGLEGEATKLVEFGAYRKVGDVTTSMCNASGLVTFTGVSSRRIPCPNDSIPLVCSTDCVSSVSPEVLSPVTRSLSVALIQASLVPSE